MYCALSSVIYPKQYNHSMHMQLYNPIKLHDSFQHAWFQASAMKWWDLHCSGYYGIYSGSSLPTFWDNLSVPSSRVKKSSWVS